MAYFRCINNKDYLEILKGTNNPSNNDGVNGQVYLKYSDYNSLYDFKEYIEVGSTAGAYIDTNIFFNVNSEFEIKAKWTEVPSSSDNKGFFGAWISNQDTDYQCYNGKGLFYIGGSGTNNLTLDTNDHIYKATQSELLIDNNNVGTPNWNNAVTSRTIYIFNLHQHNPCNNCRIYYIKLWTNDSLTHYFVPVERKSDNEAGMLDIITGIFYDNDGTQSFTVGGTPSVTFNYPITQAYSKINSTWENLIGTDVRKIMSGQKYNYVVTGTFTTANTTDTEVDVYCGFEPDIVYVEMEFDNGITKAIGYNGMNHSMWDLTPIEDRVYSVEMGSSTPTQTGISDFTSTGFKYNAHAGNTLNKNCTFYAIKMNEEKINIHNIISIIEKEFPYKDASPVNYEQVIDGKILGHLDMTNEGRQGTYMLPAKTGYNKLSLYIKESQDGQETQVNINDYDLVTTGSSEGNYFYHLYYSNPNYIYSIRFEYTGIYRVSGTLTVDIIVD